MLQTATRLCSTKKILFLVVAAVATLSASAQRKSEDYDTTRKILGSVTEITVSTKKGVPVEIIRLKDGLKDGLQEKYGYNGKIKEKYMYSKGHQHGEALLFDGNGTLTAKLQYKYNKKKGHSLLHGHYITYSNGSLQSRSMYKDSLKHSSYIEFYSNGVTKEISEFKDGLSEGTVTKYNQDGSLRSVVTYRIFSENGVKKSYLDGDAFYYNNTGKIREEGNLSKGKKEGLWRVYGPLNTESEITFRQDKKYGPYIYYHGDGKLKEIGTLYSDTLVNSKRLSVYDGPRKSFYSTGSLQSSENYVLGKREGEQKIYHDNGGLKELSLYRNGLLTGTQIYQDMKGNKTLEVSYKIIIVNGVETSVKDGPEKRWENNVLVYDGNYSSGVTQGQQRNYHARTGQLHNEFESDSGLLMGVSKSYYMDKTIQYVKHHLVYRDQNGKKRSREIGWGLHYDEQGQLILRTFLDSNGSNLITITYQNNTPLSASFSDFLQVTYAPNGKVNSFSIGSNPYSMLSRFYYLNGNVRRVIFQDPEKLTVSGADLFDDGTPLNSFSYGHELIDSLKPHSAFLNDQLKSIGKNLQSNPLFSVSIRNGTYTLNNADGSLLAQMSFANDVLDGPFLVLDPVAKDTLVYRNYTNGKNKGYFIEKFGGRHTNRRGYYTTNHRRSWDENYSRNGKIERRTEYGSNGEAIRTTEYYPGKNVKSINDKLTGHYESYDEKGFPVTINTPISDTPKIISIREFHSGSEKIKSLKYRINGVSDSTETRYYLSGKIQSIGFYSLGRRNGSYEEFDESGKLIRRGSYIDDRQHGPWVVWKNGVPDTSIYAMGKLNVTKPAYSCACIDTTESSSKYQFMNSLSVLSEYKVLRKQLNKNIIPVDSMNFRSIFMTDYYPSGGGSGEEYGSVSLKLFKDFSVMVPANEQLKINFTPCRTNGYLGTVDVRYRYTEDAPEKTSANIEMESVSIEFLKGPLKSDDSAHKHFRAFLDIHEANYSFTDGLSFTGSPYNDGCFTPGIINNFLRINVHSAGPVFQQRNHQTSDKRMPFYGLYITQATLSFKINIRGASTEITARSSDIRAGGEYVSGSIAVLCSRIGEDTYSIKNDGKSITITKADLLSAWHEHGINDIQLNYLDETKTLKINFYAE